MAKPVIGWRASSLASVCSLAMVKRRLARSRRKLPKARKEEPERPSWASEDSTDSIDWGRGRRATFPHLKSSLRTISLRLPEMMLVELKALASQRGVPYPSLLKTVLAERIAQELESLARKGKR
jgi:predicted DNA binding CopG/RHH family protein